MMKKRAKIFIISELRKNFLKRFGKAVWNDIQKSVCEREKGRIVGKKC